MSHPREANVCGQRNNFYMYTYLLKLPTQRAWPLGLQHIVVNSFSLVSLIKKNILIQSQTYVSFGRFLVYKYRHKYTFLILKINKGIRIQLDFLYIWRPFIQMILSRIKYYTNKIDFLPEIVKLLRQETFWCVKDNLFVGSRHANILRCPCHRIRGNRVDNNFSCR